MVGDSTKILLLEDNQTDADLIIRELKKSGLSFTSEIVQTREAFESALDGFKPDIVLSDYALPSFDGLTAFHIKQKKSPDIPFIIVSGVLSDESTNELIKKGVTDYVQKDKLFTIPLKLTRALKEGKEKEERDRLASILENTTDYVGIASLDMTIIYANKAAMQALKIADKAALSNIKITDIVPPGLMESFRDYAVTQTMNKGKWEGETIWCARDGTEIPVSQVNLLHTNGKGEPMFFSTIARNISERKKTEESLHMAEESYRNIFNNSLDGIYQSTMEGKLILVNPAMAKIFGYGSPEEMMSSITNIATQLYANSQERAGINDLIAKEGKALGIEFRCWKKNREIIWVRDNVRVIYDTEGKIKYYEGTLADITARIKSENELKVKNEELAKINNQMEDFLYSTSHGLRSPVSSILGLVNLLRFDVKEEVTLDYLSKIADSAYKLDSTIKDIANFSRTSYQNRASVKIDFKNLINKVVSQYEHMVDFRKNSLEVTVDDATPFYSDYGKLEIVMENLIRNSITFFDLRKVKPFIKIQIKMNAESATVEIWDNGIGIGKSHFENIFKMFYRASERAKGPGLGLFIVKESLLKLMATIEVESEIGFGTLFRLHIPNDHKGKLINRKLQLQQHAANSSPHE